MWRIRENGHKNCGFHEPFQDIILILHMGFLINSLRSLSIYVAAILSNFANSPWEWRPRYRHIHGVAWRWPWPAAVRAPRHSPCPSLFCASHSSTCDPPTVSVCLPAACVAPQSTAEAHPLGSSVCRNENKDKSWNSDKQVLGCHMRVWLFHNKTFFS